MLHVSFCPRTLWLDHFQHSILFHHTFHHFILPASKIASPHTRNSCCLATISADSDEEDEKFIRYIGNSWANPYNIHTFAVQWRELNMSDIQITHRDFFTLFFHYRTHTRHHFLTLLHAAPSFSKKNLASGHRFLWGWLRSIWDTCYAFFA